MRASALLENIESILGTAPTQDSPDTLLVPAYKVGLRAINKLLNYSDIEDIHLITIGPNGDHYFRITLCSPIGLKSSLEDLWNLLDRCWASWDEDSGVSSRRNKDKVLALWNCKRRISSPISFSIPHKYASRFHSSLFALDIVKDVSFADTMEYREFSITLRSEPLS